MPHGTSHGLMLDHEAEGRLYCWNWAIGQLSQAERDDYTLVLAALQAWTAAPDGGRKWNGRGIVSSVTSFTVQEMYMKKVYELENGVFKSFDFEMRENSKLAYEGKSLDDKD